MLKWLPVSDLFAGASNWSKTGVMIRESLTADSRHAFALASAASGYAFQRRPDTAGFSVNTAGPAGQAPGWVRLVRTGPQIQAFYSADGKAWTSIGTDAIPMADTVYVGIATTSHKTSQATDVTLDSLTITPAGSSSNQPPQAAITSPADGSSFTAGKDIVVTAAASDADGTIARVDFFAGSTPIGSRTSSPYSVTWPAVPAGTYTLKAVAVDNDGASTSSSTVSIRVDPAANQPPTVTLTSPANGATFAAPATVSLAATASDSDGHDCQSRVLFGTTLLNSDGTAPYAFSWTSVPAGTYGVRAVAYRQQRGQCLVCDGDDYRRRRQQAADRHVDAHRQRRRVHRTCDGLACRLGLGFRRHGRARRVLFRYDVVEHRYDCALLVLLAIGRGGKLQRQGGGVRQRWASASSATATITVSTVTSSGLVGAYSLNEGTGLIAGDSSGVGPSGAIKNATWTAGHFGQGLSFAGMAKSISETMISAGRSPWRDGF